MSADIIPFPGTKKTPFSGLFPPTDDEDALDSSIPNLICYSQTPAPPDNGFGMFRNATAARVARQRTRDWQMAGLIHAIAQRVAFGDDELYRINIPQLSNKLYALAHLSALDSAPREPDPDPFLVTVMNSVVHFIAERLAWGEPSATDTEPGRVMTVVELGDYLADLADRCHKDIQRRGKDNDQTEGRQD